jgi:ribokinase
MTILSFGSFCIDHVYRVPHFVRPGETLAALDYQVFAGGKGLNQSLAIARAGAKVSQAGSIGEDGRWLIEILQREGVDVSHVHLASVSTGHARIQVDPSGENSIVLIGGANRTISPEQIDDVLRSFGPGDSLLLQNEVSHVEHLLRSGKARGMHIVFNPAPMDEFAKSLPLELVDLLIVNEVEAAGLTGVDDVESMLTTMRQRVPQTTVVLTLGGAGAIWQSPDKRFHTPAVPVQVVDTTGAGDTFIGYLMAGLEQDSSPERAMALAAKAASLCVSRRGAADSIPTRDEVAPS